MHILHMAFFPEINKNISAKQKVELIKKYAEFEQIIFLVFFNNINNNWGATMIEK